MNKWKEKSPDAKWSTGDDMKRAFA
jgi:hypothetical protein